MAHESFDELKAKLADAVTLVTVGAHYTHYKHPERPYLVAGLTILEATDEVAVRYSPVAEPAIEFTRPVASWLDVVEWQGKVVPRFTKTM